MSFDISNYCIMLYTEKTLRKDVNAIRAHLKNIQNINSVLIERVKKRAYFWIFFKNYKYKKQIENELKKIGSITIDEHEYSNYEEFI